MTVLVSIFYFVLVSLAYNTLFHAYIHFSSDFEVLKEDPDPTNFVDALLEILPHKKRKNNLNKAKSKFPNRKNRVKQSHEAYLFETLEQNGDTIDSDLEDKDVKSIVQEIATWSCQFCTKFHNGKFSDYFGMCFISSSSSLSKSLKKQGL